MAFGIMPKLGEPETCDGPCKHRDCAATRAMVDSPCGICGEPIRSGDRFYNDPNDGLIHAICAEKRAGRR